MKKITLLAFLLLSGLSIKAQCVASFTVNQTSGNTFSFMSTSTPTPAPGTFSWSFGDSQYNYTSLNPTHTYASTGTYIVTFAFFDSLAACQASHMDTVIVTTVSGIHEESNNTQISISPNPSTDVLMISSASGAKAKTFEIIDLEGRVIERNEFESNIINVSSLDKGTYVLRLDYGNGEFIAQRFVKN